jgi:hypothetical protein
VIEPTSAQSLDQDCSFHFDCLLCGLSGSLIFLFSRFLDAIITGNRYISVIFCVIWKNSLAPPPIGNRRLSKVKIG